MKKREQIIPDLLARLKQELDSKIVYHNYDHTESVLSELRELIAATPELSAKEAEILLVAAAGHDLGYLIGAFEHEEKSVRLMKEILVDYPFDETEKEKIYALILATKFPTSPRNLMEQLLCDADVSSLGRSDFFDWADKLRREMENLTSNVFSDREWLEFEHGFITGIHFSSPAGIARYEKIRQLNAAKLLRKLEKLIKVPSHD